MMKFSSRFSALFGIFSGAGDIPEATLTGHHRISDL
jgi:hypothetical protein